ncbi:MAG: PfkB family carbohydrate kinase [Opitutaceae bacterium]|jgi:sugar/nucleoside kinase (ribokinase family)
MTGASEPREGVIAGGNWIVDRVKFIDAWPPEDSLANIQSELSGNGGAPYNVLKNLKRLGAGFPLEAVGLVGEDADGDTILEDCRRHGIDTAQLRRTPGAATSYTDVMTVRGTGRRTFFHQRGANALLGPEQFAFNTTRCKMFHLGYILLLDRLDDFADGKPRAAEVLRRAREAGLRTSLDCVSENSDRFRSVVCPVLPEVDLFFANDTEAEKLTGIELREAGAVRASGVERAAGALLRSGVREWVILHFPEGAYALNRSGEGRWQPSLAVPSGSIAGVAGAGDAFASGVLYAQHLGWPMQEALRLGVCAAASSLTKATCSDGVLTAAECLGLEGRWATRKLPA